MHLDSIEARKMVLFDMTGVHSVCTISVLRVKREDHTIYSLTLRDSEQQKLYEQIERVVLDFVENTYVPACGENTR